MQTLQNAEIEEADAWRDGRWDLIRRRGDCRFVMTTKRPERIKDRVPPGWGDGWEHVYISISIENQEMADIRLNAFLEAPVKHREVFCSPFLRDGKNIGKWNLKEQIKCAEEIQYELEGTCVFTTEQIKRRMDNVSEAQYLDGMEMG